MFTPDLARTAWFKVKMGASYCLDYPCIAPLSAVLSVTARCNGRCVYCNAWNIAEKTHDASTDDMVAYIGELHDLGVREIVFSGGEPFLRNDLIRLVSFARSKDLSVRIITNGCHVQRQHIERLAVLGITRLSVSIDTFDACVHKQIKGTNLNRILLTLKWLAGSRKNFPEMEIALFSVVHRLNIGQLLPIVDYAMEHGFVNLFRPLEREQDIEERVNSVWPEERQICLLRREIEDILKKKADGYAVSNSAEYLRSLPDYYRGTYRNDRRCFAAFMRVHIDKNLDVRPCWFLPGIGNLRYRSLRRIWFSAAMKGQRRNIRHRQCPRCLWPLHSVNILRRFV